MLNAPYERSKTLLNFEKYPSISLSYSWAFNSPLLNSFSMSSSVIVPPVDLKISFAPY